MTVSLHLVPELEAGLSAQSWQSGWVLEDYLLTLIENAARPSRSEKASPDRAEAVHRMLAIGEKHHLSLGEPITRAMMHEGHRF